MHNTNTQVTAAYQPIEGVLVELARELPMVRLEALDRGFALFNIVAIARALEISYPGDFARFLLDRGVSRHALALIDWILSRAGEALGELAEDLKALFEEGRLTTAEAQLAAGAIYERLDEFSVDTRDVLDALV